MTHAELVEVMARQIDPSPFDRKDTDWNHGECAAHFREIDLTRIKTAMNKARAALAAIRGAGYILMHEDIVACKNWPENAEYSLSEIRLLLAAGAIRPEKPREGGEDAA